MTDTKAVELNPGTSYWIDFKSTKDGRNLKVAATIVDVDGVLMAEAFDGHRFELPEQINYAKAMNAFQRLRWKSNCYKRVGDHDGANQLMIAAYFAMDNDFYLTRIEHLTRVWGGHSNGLLQEYVDELRRFRPDLPIDQLTFVREQNAKRAALRERMEAELEGNDNTPSTFERFANGVGKLLGLRP